MIYLQIVVLLVSFVLLSCKESTPPKTATTAEVPKQIEHNTGEVVLPDTIPSKKAISDIGEEIQGDFDGDGNVDFATAVRTKEGHGNPVEDGVPDEYEIHFSRSTLPPVKVGCCYFWLINEGDLNNDGADDISIFQEPMNGCTYSMATYSFIKNRWKEIVKSFLIPTACEGLRDDELRKRIFKENDRIYYYDTDPNDWSLKKVLVR